MPAGKPKPIRITAPVGLARKDAADRNCKRPPFGTPKAVLLAAHRAKMAQKAVARARRLRKALR